MTNFRRALLALITFITGVGLSLGVGGGTASAWHTNSSCVNYTWVITYPNEDWSNGPANFDYNVGTDAAGVLPGESRTAPDNATSASITWANSNDTDTETRPRGCTKPEKPADGYTERTVDGTCTVGQNTVDVKVYRTPFTWVYNVQTNTWDKVVGAEFLFSTTPRNLTEAEQITCKPARGYTDRRESADCSTGDITVTVTVYRTLFWFEYINGVWTKVYGPETVLSTSERPLNEAEQERCAPSYRPEVKVVETSCETGDTQITITTTTTTFHAEYIDGAWVKVANEPTVEVTYRSLNEREQNRCKPADESITRRATEDCTTGANTVTVTLYQTNFTWVYVDEVWVKVQDGDEFVVTTAERPLNEAEQKQCQPDDEHITRTDNGECSVGDTTVTVTEYRTNFTWAYVDGEWVKSQDGDEFVTDTYERTLTEDEITTCVPTHEPKVVIVDDGVPVCGDTEVNTTTTTTTYSYTYEYVNEVPVWVEHVTVVVSHGTRTVSTEACPLISVPVAPFVNRSELCEVKDQFQVGPTTGVVYNVTNGVLNQGQIVVIVATPSAGYKFAGEAQIVTYTIVGGTVQDCPVPPTTVPPTTVSVTPVPLPKTGGGLSGLGIGGILFGTGTLLTVAALRRRKVRNA